MFQRLLCVSVANPYIVYTNRNYFDLYDPPHLLENVRNNPKEHCYSVVSSDEDIEDAKVCWQHSVTFYRTDSILPIHMASKLTKQDVELPTFLHSTVRLAAHVLNHSVLARIMTFVGQVSNGTR